MVATPSRLGDDHFSGALVEFCPKVLAMENDLCTIGCHRLRSVGECCYDSFCFWDCHTLTNICVCVCVCVGGDRYVCGCGWVHAQTCLGVGTNILCVCVCDTPPVISLNEMGSIELLSCLINTKEYLQLRETAVPLTINSPNGITTLPENAGLTN